jgi:hypothetical protein
MIPVEVTDDTLLNYLVLVVEEGNNSGVGEVIDYYLTFFDLALIRDLVLLMFR